MAYSLINNLKIVSSTGKHKILLSSNFSVLYNKVEQHNITKA